MSMTPADRSLLVLAEQRFRADRHAARRCACKAYHSEIKVGHVLVRCADRGVQCPFAGMYPIVELEKAKGARA